MKKKVQYRTPVFRKSFGVNRWLRVFGKDIHFLFQISWNVRTSQEDVHNGFAHKDETELHAPKSEEEMCGLEKALRGIT